MSTSRQKFLKNTNLAHHKVEAPFYPHTGGGRAPIPPPVLAVLKRKASPPLPPESEVA